MRTYAALLVVSALLLGCGRDPATLGVDRATRVAISSLDHKDVAVLTSAPELTNFNAHWQAKHDTGKTNEGMPITSFQFFLDVETNGSSGRWLYSTQGLVVRLDHKGHALYQVPRASEFNRLLRITK